MVLADGLCILWPNEQTLINLGLKVGEKQLGQAQKTWVEVKDSVGVGTKHLWGGLHAEW